MTDALVALATLTILAVFGLAVWGLVEGIRFLARCIRCRFVEWQTERWR